MIMKETNNNNPLAELMAGEPTPVEVAPGLTAQEMRAIYFDADALREPPYRLYRLDEQGYRYYYRIEGDRAVLYPSVTTLLRQTTPTSPFLIKWMVENGDAATEKRDMAAAYGTFMHIQFERLIILRTYDLDKAGAVLRDYMEQENIPDKYYFEWLPRIRKDILAFAQFIKDYNVKPLAVEISLVSSLGYAGCIDLPCEMTSKGETFRAIIDFKSGRNGFYEDYELQLGLYRDMWNENFPDTPIKRIFNFAPKDWRKSPTYNLKEQTDAPSLATLPHIIAIASIKDDKRDKDVTYCDGVIKLDEPLDDHFHTISLAELLTTKHAGEQEQAETLFKAE